MVGSFPFLPSIVFCNEREAVLDTEVHDRVLGHKQEPPAEMMVACLTIPFPCLWTFWMLS